MKIEVFLRRRQVSDQHTPVTSMEIGKYMFDPLNMTLTLDENEKQLTMKESEVLKYFGERINELIPRKDLLIGVWGKDDYFLGRSLDVFISKLRKYLSGDDRIVIQNVHGVGFKMIINK